LRCDSERGICNENINKVANLAAISTYITFKAIKLDEVKSSIEDYVAMPR
jgi:hypothetical protein